jgi:hypothetical protein
MQEAYPFSESPVVQITPPGSSLTAIQRRIVVGMLLGTHFFAAVLCPGALAEQSSEPYWVILWGGQKPALPMRAWCIFKA